MIGYKRLKDYFFLLEYQELTCSQIAKETNTTQQTAWRNMKVLSRLGLIRRRKDQGSKKIYYKVTFGYSLPVFIDKFYEGE